MVNNSSVRKKKEKLHSFTVEYYLKMIKLTELNFTFINNVTLQINRSFPFCNLQNDSSKLFICKLLFLYWIDVWGSLCLPVWFMFCMQMAEWLAVVSTLVMSCESSVEMLDVVCPGEKVDFSPWNKRLEKCISCLIFHLKERLERHMWLKFLYIHSIFLYLSQFSSLKYVILAAEMKQILTTVSILIWK